MQGAISFRVLHCLFLFECTPTFILYHQHSARWSGLFNYLFIMPIIGGGGGNFFFEGWTFCLGVIANIGGGRKHPPENPSMVICYLVTIVYVFFSFAER